MAHPLTEEFNKSHDYFLCALVFACSTGPPTFHIVSQGMAEGQATHRETRTSASPSTDAIQRQEKVEVDFYQRLCLPVPPGHSRSLEESRFKFSAWSDLKVVNAVNSFASAHHWCACSSTLQSAPSHMILAERSRASEKNKDRVNAHVPPQTEDLPTQKRRTKTSATSFSLSLFLSVNLHQHVLLYETTTLDTQLQNLLQVEHLPRRAPDQACASRHHFQTVKHREGHDSTLLSLMFKARSLLFSRLLAYRTTVRCDRLSVTELLVSGLVAVCVAFSCLSVRVCFWNKAN